MRGMSRLLIAAVMALIGLFSYFGSSQKNPTTGEVQHVAMSPQQEVAIGLQAAPEMAGQMGGELDDPAVQAYVNAVGNRVVAQSAAQNSPYRFQFHVLADPKTINAFALPGGQVFITAGLLSKLRNEAQLAGVLGHEVGHVIGRHTAEHMAKGQLTQMLVGAAGVAASDNSGHGQSAAMIASMVGQMTNLRFSRKDESEADDFGVRFMSEAGYDPRQMIGVMDILEASSGGSGGSPEWLQTHPNPGNRRDLIKQEIATKFPDGVPAQLGKGDDARFGAMRQRLGA